MKLHRSAGLALAAFVYVFNPAISGAQQTAPPPKAAAPAPAQPKPTAPEPAEPKADAQKAKADAQNTNANPDAVILADFKDRIDKYLAVRDQAKKGAPPMKETTDPTAIKTAQLALAARIRELRADAQPGDIFTPQIRDKFRRLMYPELKGEDGQDAKAVAKDDAPPVAAIPFKPNAPYPEGKPLPTVPTNLLLSLPTLPKELEYRIIDKHLILRDNDASIIIDYIPGAIR